jgi:hypothetical protein
MVELAVRARRRKQASPMSAAGQGTNPLRGRGASVEVVVFAVAWVRA